MKLDHLTLLLIHLSDRMGYDVRSLGKPMLRLSGLLLLQGIRPSTGRALGTFHKSSDNNHSYSLVTVEE